MKTIKLNLVEKLSVKDYLDIRETINLYPIEFVSPSVTYATLYSRNKEVEIILELPIPIPASFIKDEHVTWDKYDTLNFITNSFISIAHTSFDELAIDMMIYHAPESYKKSTKFSISKCRRYCLTDKGLFQFSITGISEINLINASNIEFKDQIEYSIEEFPFEVLSLLKDELNK